MPVYLAAWLKRLLGRSLSVALMVTKGCVHPESMLTGLKSQPASMVQDELGSLENLNRDISTFEGSFRALLETLERFVTHSESLKTRVDSPSDLFLAEGTIEQVTREQHADHTMNSADMHHGETPDRTHEMRFPIGTSTGVDELRTSYCVVNSDARMLLKPQNHVGSLKTGNSRLLMKLDQSWADIYRTYEEEADARLDEYLEPAQRKMTAARSELQRPCINGLVLYPHSPAKVIWDFLGGALLACDVITIPILIAWDQERYGIFAILFYTSLLFWSLDLVLSFNTGYYLQQAVVLDRCKICLRYCRSWLLFDVFLLSVDFIFLAIPSRKSLRALRFLRVVRLLKLLRMIKMSKAAGAARAALNSIDNQDLTLVNAIIKIVFFNILIPAHIMACSWFFVGRMGKAQGLDSWLDTSDLWEAGGPRQYLVSFFWVLAQVTPAPMSIHPQNPHEQLFNVIVILFSLFVFGGSLAKLRGALDSINRRNFEQSTKKAQLIQYLRNCQAPVELSARVFQFASHQLELSAKLVQQPPPGLIPKELIEELALYPRKPTLINHPLFLLFDFPVAHLGATVKKLCNEALIGRMYASQQDVFVEGTLAQWMFLAKAGAYDIEERENVEGLTVRAPCWFAEVCLFTRHSHSSTLRAASFGEGFVLSHIDLISCVQSSAIAIFSVSQYARTFLALVSSKFGSRLGAVPDYMPREISEEACGGIHLQMLDASSRQQGERDWERSRQDICAFIDLRKQSDPRGFLEAVFQETLVPDQIGNQIQSAFPELASDGAFHAFEHSTECECVTAAISSAVLLISNQYEAFVMNQEDDARLTLQQWAEFQQLVRWAKMNSKAAHAMFVFLLLRGLVKSKKFAQVFAHNVRRTRNQMLIKCLTEEGLDNILPSIAALDTEQIDLIMKMCAVYEEFNLPQFLQAENLPHSVAMLKERLSHEKASAFRACLFAQVCMMCGLSGSRHLVGSAFMTSAKSVPVLLGVIHLRDLETHGAFHIYFSYILARSIHLGLQGRDREALAFARLICLSRIVDQEDLKPLHDAWHGLSSHDKTLLTDHLLSDGIDEFAIIILFLPMYLSNALENKVVGKLRALRVLADILELLYNGNLMTGINSSTAIVDMQSLAEFTRAVRSSQKFEDCVDFLRFRKAGEKFVAVIDDVHGPGDVREQVAKIDRRVKLLISGQSKIEELMCSNADTTAKFRDQRAGFGFEHSSLISQNGSKIGSNSAAEHACRTRIAADRCNHQQLWRNDISV